MKGDSFLRENEEVGPSRAFPGQLKRCSSESEPVTRAPSLLLGIAELVFESLKV
jgi:hypothetical protein